MLEIVQNMLWIQNQQFQLSFKHWQQRTSPPCGWNEYYTDEERNLGFKSLEVLFLICLLQLPCFWFYLSGNYEVNSLAPVSPLPCRRIRRWFLSGIWWRCRQSFVGGQKDPGARRDVLLSHSGHVSPCCLPQGAATGQKSAAGPQHGPVPSVLRDMWGKIWFICDFSCKKFIILAFCPISGGRGALLHSKAATFCLGSLNRHRLFLLQFLSPTGFTRDNMHIKLRRKDLCPTGSASDQSPQRRSSWSRSSG